MLNANWKVTAGLFTASLLLSVAAAQASTANAPVQEQAANASGPVLWVDPPSPNQQPITVAIPLSGQHFKPMVEQSAKSASPSR